MINHTSEEAKILKKFIGYGNKAQPIIEKHLDVKFEWYITIQQIVLGAGSDVKNNIIYFGKRGLVEAYELCKETNSRPKFCFEFISRFVMLHEAIHLSGLNHSKAGRKLGYKSDLTKDMYTRNMMIDIFGYKKEDFND